MPIEENQDEETVAPDFSNPAPAPVTLTEPEHDEDGDDEEPKTRDPKTGKWTAKARTRDRGRGKMRGELDELRQQNTSLQAKLDAFTTASQSERAAMLDMVRRVATPATGQQPDPAAEEVETLMERLKTERDLLARDPKRSTDAYDKIQSQPWRAHARAEYAALQAKGGQPVRQNQGDEARKAVWRSQIESEFPWAATNQKAVRAAADYRNYLISTGSPDTIETLRIAVGHVGSQMGLGGVPAPSNRQRQAFASPGAGGARGAAPKQVQVDPRMLVGTGLSKERLNKVLFSDDDT